MSEINRFFHQLGPRTRVALCQLPLTVLMCTVVVVAATLYPELFSDPWFLAGLAMHLILFVGCFVVPWDRLHPEAHLVVPLLDLAAIGLTRHAALEVLPGLSGLSVFPVIWLSASGLKARYGLPISFVGPLLIVLPSLAVRPDQSATTQPLSALLLPVMMVTVWAAVHFATANARLQRHILEQKDAELRSLLRRSEERERLLATILETVDVGIAAVDRHGKLVQTNGLMRRFHGLPSHGGGPLTDMSTDTGASRLLSLDRQTPLEGDRHPLRRAINGETFTDYLVWIDANGTQRAVSTAARAMSDDDGAFRGSVLMYSDVTSLMEAIASQEDLVSNVSHELRTPLTSIVGNLDLVLEEWPDLSPSTEDRLDAACKSAERLLELVSDLLFAASSTLSVQARPTDLAAVVESSIGSVAPQAEAAGVELRWETRTPLWAVADPLRMAQVLDNLLTNAIKYSPSGGTVTVTAEEDPDAVTLRVADTGMGMEPGELVHVFNRFYRTETARNSGIPGTGLGLSIAKGIVEGHGGTIRCNSASGRGTTFTVVLPEAADASRSRFRSRGVRI
ncbi:sensor histidine kinase [Arthrobacter sp. KK5.5]|uniref:sensor histidine kinase n=1 Tax=Arthrobacter sp. KK5.5 TaxID=3373084 RepID=UPI003EE46716